MTSEWSDEVLEQTPARATKFLSGVGAEPVVRTLLAKAGMTDEAIIEGRELLLACLATPGAPKAATDTDSARAQREAVADIDAWDEPNFARFEATLARHAPGVGAVVFHDLKAATGDESVKGVATFLARLDGLDHAIGGANTSTDAKVSDAVLTASASFKGVPAKERETAAKLLVQRGLDAATRAHLRGLVATALGPTTMLGEEPAADAGLKAQRLAALRALRGWYDEWSKAARAVVKKRGYLIRLGLAKRKPPTKPPEEKK